jgi:hypothetical protein
MRKSDSCSKTATLTETARFTSHEIASLASRQLFWFIVPLFLTRVLLQISFQDFMEYMKATGILS